MRKILLMVVGAILLVVIAVVSTLAIVKIGESDTEQAAPAAEQAAEEEEDDEEEEEEEDEEDVEDDEDDEDESEFSGSDAIYYEFHPSFVVNITDGDRARYLAVDLSVVGYQQSHIDALRAHMPAIRNDLIILFSAQDAGPLRGQEGKETLRREALAVIRNVMQSKFGQPAIQEVYFNKFVIQ